MHETRQRCLFSAFRVAHDLVHVVVHLIDDIVELVQFRIQRKIRNRLSCLAMIKCTYCRSTTGTGMILANARISTELTLHVNANVRSHENCAMTVAIRYVMTKSTKAHLSGERNTSCEPTRRLRSMRRSLRQDDFVRNSPSPPMWKTSPRYLMKISVISPTSWFTSSGQTDCRGSKHM